jgi:hypothetical protein
MTGPTVSHYRIVAPTSFFFLHLLANDFGVARFRIDHRGHGQTTTGHRVGIFLLNDYAVFDEFGSGWWLLAPDGRRGRGNRLLLRRATSQKKAEYQPGFPHALCFRSLVPACRWQSWLQLVSQ